MKYLVTGGAGFIGSNFVKYLLKVHGPEAEILILDSLTYAGNLLTIKDEIELPNVEFVKGDIGDADLVDRLMKEFDPDFVVNFAAESHVDRSITNPRLFLETNILERRPSWRLHARRGSTAPMSRDARTTARERNSFRFPPMRYTARCRVRPASPRRSTSPRR